MDARVTYEPAGALDGPRDVHRRLDLVQVLATVLRRWWLVLLCGLVAAGGALAVVRLFPYQYTATGDLVVDSRSFSIPELQGAISAPGSPDPVPSVRTEAIQLVSPVLLQTVVRDLRLTDDPEFNPSLRPPDRLQEAMDWLRGLLPGKGAPPVAHADPTVAIAADELARHLSVFYDNRSFVISISAVVPDPDLAPRIVNTVMRRYLDLRASSRAQENAEANAALTKRVEEVRQQIDALDGKLRDLRAKNELVALPAGSLGQQRLAELATAATQASGERQRLEATLQQASALAAAGRVDELATVLSSPTIAALRQQEVMSAARVSAMSTMFGARHPARRSAEEDLRRVQSEIAGETARLERSLSVQVAAARDREATAQKALQQASLAASKNSLVQNEIAQLEKDMDSRRALYQTLLERASQTAIDPETAKQSAGVHIGAPAVPPVNPSGPHPKQAGLVAGFAGMALGCLLALVRGTEPPFFSNPGEIAALTDVPLLAVVSQEAARRRRLSGGRQLVRADAAGPPGAGGLQEEALGFLRLRLRQQAMQTGHEVRSVLFVAAEARGGDEPVQTAADFARAFARNAARGGERVLLLEPADSATRDGRPMALLDGVSAWREALARDAESPAHVLAIPSRCGDTAGGRDAARLRSLLREAADDYTLTVVSSPGEAVSMQTSQLIDVTDTTLLLIDPRQSRRRTVLGAINHLRSVSHHVGLVIIGRRQSENFS